MAVILDLPLALAQDTMTPGQCQNPRKVTPPNCGALVG